MDRRAFMKLPMDCRRKILREQVTSIKNHYDELVGHEDLGWGDILD
ncbi:MAG: hypothetical protein PHD01_13605 [Geobacteraceae bacterium]|nr:hypothetical protein [Geobacteraceae bacterium]